MPRQNCAFSECFRKFTFPPRLSKKKFDVVLLGKSPFLKNISDKPDKADTVTRQGNPGKGKVYSTEGFRLRQGYGGLGPPSLKPWRAWKVPKKPGESLMEIAL